EEEAEEDGMGAQLLAVGGLDSAAQAQEREHMDMLLSSFSPDQTSRYEAVRRVRLKKETVRRITNQTLSQSVPASVVTTINSFTKVFICELIERARDPVQEMDRGPLTPDHFREALRRYKKD
ncbi:TAFII28-domain-containing protein, partial [Viridothelium virens]